MGAKRSLIEIDLEAHKKVVEKMGKERHEELLAEIDKIKSPENAFLKAEDYINEMVDRLIKSEDIDEEINKVISSEDFEEDLWADEEVKTDLENATEDMYKENLENAEKEVSRLEERVHELIISASNSEFPENGEFFAKLLADNAEMLGRAKAHLEECQRRRDFRRDGS